MTAPPCEACNPCEGCDPDTIILPPDVFDDGTKACDVCNPCNSGRTCSYCGNYLNRCDPTVETEDGELMHKSCAGAVD